QRVQAFNRRPSPHCDQPRPSRLPLVSSISLPPHPARPTVPLGAWRRNSSNTTVVDVQLSHIVQSFLSATFQQGCARHSTAHSLASCVLRRVHSLLSRNVLPPHHGLLPRITVGTRSGSPYQITRANGRLVGRGKCCRLRAARRQCTRRPCAPARSIPGRSPPRGSRPRQTVLPRCHRPPCCACCGRRASSPA